VAIVAQKAIVSDLKKHPRLAIPNVTLSNVDASLAAERHIPAGIFDRNPSLDHGWSVVSQEASIAKFDNSFYSIG